MQFTVTVKISDKPNSNKSFSDKEDFKGMEEEFDVDEFSTVVQDLVNKSYERFLKAKKKENDSEVGE